MFEAIKAYRLGKRTEELHDRAKSAIFASFTTLQESEPVGAAMLGFIFEENMGSDRLPGFLAEHGKKVEDCVDAMLEDNPDLKELVSITLFLKHCLCGAYGNKLSYERMLASRIFNKYCDYKFNPTGEELGRLESLICRVQGGKASHTP